MYQEQFKKKAEETVLKDLLMKQKRSHLGKLKRITSERVLGVMSPKQKRPKIILYSSKKKDLGGRNNVRSLSPDEEFGILPPIKPTCAPY